MESQVDDKNDTNVLIEKFFFKKVLSNRRVLYKATLNSGRVFYHLITVHYLREFTC